MTVRTKGRWFQRPRSLKSFLLTQRPQTTSTLVSCGPRGWVSTGEDLIMDLTLISGYTFASVYGTWAGLFYLLVNSI